MCERGGSVREGRVFERRGGCVREGECERGEGV